MNINSCQTERISQWIFTELISTAWALSQHPWTIIWTIQRQLPVGEMNQSKLMINSHSEPVLLIFVFQCQYQIENAKFSSNFWRFQFISRKENAISIQFWLISFLILNWKLIEWMIHGLWSIHEPVSEGVCIWSAARASENDYICM